MCFAYLLPDSVVEAASITGLNEDDLLMQVPYDKKLETEIGDTILSNFGLVTVPEILA